MRKKPKIHLDSYEEYRTSVLKHLEWMLENYYGDISRISVSEIDRDSKEINAYENFDQLESIKEGEVVILDDEKIDITKAEKAVLEGRFLWEHAAAGEATRLGLGTKYLLNLSHFSVDEIVGHVREEAEADLKKKGLSEDKLDIERIKLGEKINRESVLAEMKGDPNDLLDISLGNRHMLQMVFDVTKIAKKYNKDPKEILKKQLTFIVLNEQTAEEIIEEFRKFNFFGLSPENVLFMIQRSFHGIYIKEGTLFFDRTTEKNKRLHNHGQLVMQKIHNNVIFRVDPENLVKRRYLSNEEFEQILKDHDDLLSYNVEDLGYLTCSIDLPSLALALNLGEEGYNMVMEIVAQNSLKPQKGGACFYDKKLGRIVMIESNQLKDIKNEEIKHLNKNFNHYPNPVKVFQAMKKQGLPLSFDVKSMFNQSGESQDYIYPCPVQGDMNFLVKTAYVMRKKLKSIYSWKSPATTPWAVKAMLEQDKQEGFKEFSEGMMLDK